MQAMRSISALTFPIQSTPYGLTYGEWSSKWWKWLLSIPKSINPAFDSTGTHAYRNQRSDVFFLCQTLESVKSTPHRRVMVSAGQAIFMPIINWISTLHIDGETDQELVTTANTRMNVIGDLQITINDATINEGLASYRVQSPIFETALPRHNILGINEGTARCVSDGYWLFLKALKNNIKISSFGSCSSGITKIAVSYDISII
jgi:hypothetical protein